MDTYEKSAREQSDDREDVKGVRAKDYAKAYVRRAGNERILGDDEVVALFQIIEECESRTRDIFHRFLFASNFYMNVLGRLERGDRRFDSVVSDVFSGNCDDYRNLVPAFRECLRTAKKRRMREETIRCLNMLSFRQEVIEEMCSEAEKLVYDRYLNLLERSNPQDREEIVRIEESMGMSPDAFIGNFKELKSVMGACNSARSRIVESNLRLVVYIAKKYMHCGYSFMDLVQEGSIGLMTAVRKFQYRKGNKFPTYAAWWIRQAITRALSNNSRTIRLPANVVEEIHKMKSAETRHASSHGRNVVSDKAIADEMGVSADRVRKLREMDRQIVSLDGAVKEGEDTTYCDFIADSNAANPAEEAEGSLLKDDIKVAMSCLSERERLVLDYHYGLSDGVSKTLEEIGKLFNVTRERIRQVEIEAIGRLRSSGCVSILAKYMRA